MHMFLPDTDTRTQLLAWVAWSELAPTSGGISLAKHNACRLAGKKRRFSVWYEDTIARFRGI